LGVALVRALSAPRAAGLCRRRHPLGSRCVERPATAARPLQLMRQKGATIQHPGWGGNSAARRIRVKGNVACWAPLSRGQDGDADGRDTDDYAKSETEDHASKRYPS
jgi:hypothetical protein